ncbi:unnamed protein product [Acanthoscelides obtectus]|uniref:ZAD domain-containing protein n=1 Tax=Acanthoscelides obtectus TaxID=200917 RepID=A0A9P0K6Y1_ACAOB|nr:unnamed protein product [Acanthoscelides obtectus]CAK1668846.1 hypothetical protein AOBTE_LOCUS26635 [Acanthoscelides obtectus]
MSSSCFIPSCKNSGVIPCPKDSPWIERVLELLKVPIANSSSYICVKHFNDVKRHQEDTGSCKLKVPRIKSDSQSSTKPVSRATKVVSHSSTELNHPECCTNEIYLANDDRKIGFVNVAINQPNVELVDEYQVSRPSQDSENNRVDHESSTIILQSTEIKENVIENLSGYDDIKEDILLEERCITDFIYGNELDRTYYQKIPELGQSSDQDSDHHEGHISYECDSLLATGSQENFIQTEDVMIINEQGKIIGTSVDNTSFDPEILSDTKTDIDGTEELEGCHVTNESQSELEHCRLCMKQQADTKDIFNDYVENDVPIYSAVQDCFFPIQISKTDKLSQKICLHCWVQLKSYFQFRKTILQNDKAQREISNQTANNHKRKIDKASPLPKKIKIGNTYLTKLSQKKDLQPANSKEKGKCITEDKGAQENESVEDKLRQVLLSTLSKEQASAENIIIHVQDENEFHNTKTILADVEEQIDTSISVCEKTIIAADGSIKKVTCPSDQDHILIRSLPVEPITIMRDVRTPKIKKPAYRQAKPSFGIFEVVPIVYLYNIEFCLLNGHLFEYRLSSLNLRNLKCILPTCRAKALQKKMVTGVYEDKAKLIVPHNHGRGDDAEKKKQMFLYIVTRKLQCDKDTNFKSIYEEICEIDPAIRDIISLRSVIFEVCRNYTTYEPPTFEQLYKDIQTDIMYKLQFTLNGKQFYQNWFSSGDSKAMLFANPDIVEELSSSQLLYVDASFKIDTSNQVKFQLVTVLMWISDSYYPAMFILINKKTRGIYEKIFQYIHDILAPKLRPAEIVTDFEANLYHVLSKVYEKASVGGSVFYYTQNLYKKVCVLNLCKNLETNSYLRHFYHMLLMLPLLPVVTISDVWNTLLSQAKDSEMYQLMKPLFDHVKAEWMEKVTPDLFGCHRYVDYTISPPRKASIKCHNSAIAGIGVWVKTS